MNYDMAAAATVVMCTDPDLFRRAFDAGLNEYLYIETVDGSSVPRQIFKFARHWYLRDGTAPSRSVLEGEFEQFFKNNDIPAQSEYQPEYAVNFLKNNAVKARIQLLVRDAYEQILDPDSDQVQQLGQFHRDVSRLYVDVSATGDIQDIAMAAPEVVKNLFVRAGDTQMYRDGLIKFPFDVMNQYFFGLRPRELALFFGYTGDMKSLTLELATIANASAGKRVAHYTLENGIEATTIRFLAILSGLPMNRLQSGGIAPKEMDALNAARDTLASLPIRLDQSASVDERSVEAIFTKARSYQADLVVIDQATWVTAPDVKYGSMWENLATITRQIKLHTNEMGVATIMASQANRESQKTKQGTGLGHIGGSDELTKTSTVAATLDYDKQSGLLKVDVVKNRNGSATLSFTMNMDLDTRTFIALNQIIQN